MASQAARIVRKSQAARDPIDGRESRCLDDEMDTIRAILSSAYDLAEGMVATEYPLNATFAHALAIMIEKAKALLDEAQEGFRVNAFRDARP